MNIYFAGAIRGGRQKVEDYKKIVEFLQRYGDVLTTHIADNNINSTGEKNINANDIYKRDKNWLDISDIVITEVSIPSLDVGYEIGYGVSSGKKVIALYDTNSEYNLSAMIKGNDKVYIVNYSNVDELLKILDDIIN